MSIPLIPKILYPVVLINNDAFVLFLDNPGSLVCSFSVVNLLQMMRRGAHIIRRQNTWNTLFQYIIHVAGISCSLVAQVVVEPGGAKETMMVLCILQ
jgi:hypothetical protein